MTESEHNRPFVSVIIPVYNDPEGIRRCLKALIVQTYPGELFEIIVVDNGSTEHTQEVVREFDVTLRVEDEIQGSYAARNTGIEAADGEIVAFTDADCTPDSEWIQAGVAKLGKTEADMAAGRVRFEFSEERTAAERFDASVNMRNDKNVGDGIAKTANLFIRSRVFETVGMFPEHLLSGGDVYWTKSATDAGFELVYAPKAIVSHPSRKLQDLLRKQYRVGKGQIQIWRLENRSALWILFVGSIRFPLKVLMFLFDTGGDNGNSIETPPDRVVDRGLAVYAVAGLCMLAMTLGRIHRLFAR